MPMEFDILGVGVWGLTIRSWSDLQTVFGGGSIEEDGSKGPKPELIPANERRRAPLPVRLAVESSWQACESSGLNPAELCSVFVSGIGDTQLTDYMCRVLAGENKALSPTKFHNSVHNAAAGYWTISTGCRQSANSVAGFQESVSLAFMEALVEATIEQKPILLTFYDAPSSSILKELLFSEHSFAASLVLVPSNLSNSFGATKIASCRAEVSQTTAEWPKLETNSELEACYASNPAAKILAFLHRLWMVNDQVDTSISMPLSSATSLAISLSGQT